MAHLTEVISHLDELLEAPDFPDYGPNGLQVPGPEEVTIVATGVSAHRQMFEGAAEAGAQLVIAHHGLFWDFHPRSLSPTMKERLRVLFENDIALASYHLPLDAHPEVGNNALICAALGLEQAEPFGRHRGRSIGFVGRSAEGIRFDELRHRCAEVFGQEPFTWDSGPELVRSVGIVSGGAASSFGEAIALGLDAFLTGEPAEHVMADALESGTHFIAAGHYATETFGVRRLGELVAERFGVEHRFIAAPNPI
ncbi:MAG TPA: Nif3-like dinuclear metal center hexameric protein [Thermoleophilaceae bacterium]|nr:Nif3-like dinuclear metal center hexameric protein [Thermoleophilaceae bacterium]